MVFRRSCAADRFDLSWSYRQSSFDQFTGIRTDRGDGSGLLLLVFDFVVHLLRSFWVP